MTFDNRGQAVETSTADTFNRQLENAPTTMDSNQAYVFYIRYLGIVLPYWLRVCVGVFFSCSSAEHLIEMFPEEKLRSLITKISSPRWVVPVLPEQELECLLNYAIELTKAGKF